MAMRSESDTVLQSRLDFIGLDAPARDRLAGVQSIIGAHLETALERFYAKLGDVPAVRSFFSGKPQMDRAKAKQSRHWQAIASGQLDANYMEASARVGLRHAQIGLEPRWHIGGYGLIMETLVRGLVHDMMAAALQPEKRGFGRDRARPAEAVLADADAMAETLVAVLKSMLIDIDIGVTAYFDKLSADARAAEETSRQQIETAVTAAGDVLRSMSTGDLTKRIDVLLDGQFAQMRADTNAVVDGFTGIIGQLRQTSRALKTATGEILAGANDLAERTTRQAATLEETSASIEQLAGAVGENARRAATGSQRARAVSRSATEGGLVMAEATAAVEAIEASSNKISRIISLIDDVAFQTNLLALNASVEAARAGEAGKGFAVVAVEVRRLAQSAAQASAEVKQLIEASSAEVAAGTRLVTRAAETLRDIQAGAEDSAALIDAIATANGEQSVALDAITVAVRQMDEMTQHNVALAEETNAAMEQTEAQAGALDHIVERFRIPAQRPVAVDGAEPNRLRRVR